MSDDSDTPPGGAVGQGFSEWLARRAPGGKAGAPAFLQGWQAQLRQSAHQLAREGHGAPLGVAPTPEADLPQFPDGEKTGRHLSSGLAPALRRMLAGADPAEWDAVRASFVRQAERLCQILDAAGPQFLRPPLALPPSPLLSELRSWLLGQELPQQLEEAPALVVPVAGRRRALRAARCLVLEGGLSRALYVAGDVPRLAGPAQVVVHEGMLSGDALADLGIGTGLADGAVWLVVLADGIVELPALPEGLPWAVLPLPEDPDARALVVAWAAGERGGLRAAGIDRRRAVLVPARSLPRRAPGPLSALDWRPADVTLLELPLAERPTLLEAARDLHWRLEAEAGLVADGGASYAWLAGRLQPDGDVAYAAACVAAWQAALHRPLRRIVTNLGAHAYEPAVATWAAGGQAPLHGYRVDAGEGVPARPVVLLGDCLSVGAVAPVGQVRRVLRQAAGTAEQLALLRELVGEAVGAADLDAE